ncbi:hypothetical protein SGM_4606 [Streptomyces griseoaurantiacus M045]|uniref:Uncharacterized protein n=1 Tax=Streptomyces griseoaurantiacus M045 TaxID=996637 RepID=F3NN92_9ACTN|nr:hypothetical protein SGM_4606 [Streptomyces griseoaurantiacus M045]
MEGLPPQLLFESKLFRFPRPRPKPGAAHWAAPGFVSEHRHPGHRPADERRSPPRAGEANSFPTAAHGSKAARGLLKAAGGAPAQGGSQLSPRTIHRCVEAHGPGGSQNPASAGEGAAFGGGRERGEAANYPVIPRLLSSRDSCRVCLARCRVASSPESGRPGPRNV